MPWGINQIYENRGQFLQEQSRALVENKENKNEPAEGRNTDRQNNSQARGENTEQRGEKRRQRQKPEAQPTPLTDIAPILATAQQKWKDNPIGSITIIAPNTNQGKIELRALLGESVAHRNVYDSLEFNAVTGQNITDDSSRLKNPSVPMAIYLSLIHI